MKLSGDRLKSVCITSVLLLCCISATAEKNRFNTPGNILIADQFNNRVIEVDRHGNIVWQFDLGPADLSPASIIGVTDAQRVGELTLMTGTGTAGGQPEAPNCANPSGCPDNRVLLVDRAGHILWQYGTFGVAGSGPNRLNTPVQNTWLPGGHVLITDQVNERIIEVNLAKQIVWQYGTTGVSGNGPEQLNNPKCAELLENGHINQSRYANLERNALHHGRHCPAPRSFLWHECSVLAESTDSLRPAARPAEGGKIHQSASHFKTARARTRMKVSNSTLELPCSRFGTGPTMA